MVVVASGATARMAVPDVALALTSARVSSLIEIGRPPPLAPLLMATMAGEFAPVAIAWPARPRLMVMGPP
ncbi:hypothetical protein D3C73_1068920 [compost metagenome]